MKRTISFPLTLLLGALILTLLYLASLQSYIFFHSIVEITGVAIGFGIFIFGWNTRHLVKDSYLAFLGIAYLFISIITILHTLSYKGMGVLPEYGSDLPTQLWIASRYLLALSFLVAPFFAGRRVNPWYVLGAYAAVSTFVFLSIFTWHIFPTCYVEGAGLTPFKKVSELIISGLLAGSIFTLWRRRRNLEPPVFGLVVAATAVTIASELAFTSYVSVYGPANLIGHMLSIIAFYLIYRAIIVTGFKRPIEFICQDLEASNKALRMSEKQYRAIFENAAEGIFQSTPGGRYTNVNEAYARMMGYASPAEMIAQITDIAAQQYVNAADRQTLKDQLEKTGRVEKFETRMRKKNGDIIWVSINSQVVRDDTSGVLHFEGTGHEITERKLNEQLKDDFVGMVSHELRTPLTVILGSISTARTPGLDAEDREKLLANAEDGARDMTCIVENLLELSRHQSRRLNLFLEPLDLSRVVSENVNAVKAKHPDKLFDITVDPEARFVSADRVRVGRILFNLIENAAKYSFTGGKISIFAAKRSDEVIIGVRDEGPGISPQDRERLFEPFERLEQNDQNAPGLGLGLVVCKRLVETHGGRIWVESTPGRGTTFYFTLSAC